MKKFILLASFLLTTTCMADELHNYNEVKSAIIAGKSIHISMDINKCLAASNKQASAPTNIGVFMPNEIHISNDHMATSTLHFTLNNPAFLGQPIYEYLRYTITEDNNVNFTDQLLNPVNYALMGDKFSLDCKIDAGIKIYT